MVWDSWGTDKVTIPFIRGSQKSKAPTTNPNHQLSISWEENLFKWNAMFHFKLYFPQSYIEDDPFQWQIIIIIVGDTQTKKERISGFIRWRKLGFLWSITMFCLLSLFPAKKLISNQENWHFHGIEKRRNLWTLSLAVIILTADKVYGIFTFTFTIKIYQM